MEIKASQSKNLIPDTEVAPLLGVSVQTLRNWRSRGVGCPFIRLGSAVRYRMADVENWIEKNTVVPIGEERATKAA